MVQANSWLLRGGTIVTVDRSQPVVVGDLLIVDGRIAALGQAAGSDPRAASVPVVDVSGCVVMPGLVQAHIHLCQTLGRGLADDLPLLRWLSERVLPYEAALDERNIQLAAQVGVAELLLSGTTTLLDRKVPDAQAKAVSEIHGNRPDLLLEILHDVQREAGFISDKAIFTIADQLNLSRAEVLGVVSFYDDFLRAPLGGLDVRVCQAEA